jgi:hypothetical protein
VWGAVWEDGGGVQGDGLVVDVFQPWLEPAPAVAAQASAVDSAAAHGGADDTHHHHHRHHHHHHDDHHDATEHHHDGHAHVHSDRLTTELVAIAKVHSSTSMFSKFPFGFIFFVTFCCFHSTQ